VWKSFRLLYNTNLVHLLVVTIQWIIPRALNKRSQLYVLWIP
jgi:hypothetical protein